MSEPGFEVVALALEPRHRVERFADYYLDQGASRVRVFNDSDEDMRFDDPRIECRACSASFWSSLGIERPHGVEQRQREVFRHAYETADATWLLIVDIDEFVMGRCRLDKFMTSLPETLRSVRFETAEAVHEVGSYDDAEFAADKFRLPVSKYLAPILSAVLYGRMSYMFSRGLLGHSRGKQALRTGYSDLRIGIHDAAAGSERIGSFEVSRAAGFYLAHYDAINFAHWQQKWERRLEQGDTLEMGLKRERQLRLFSACADDRARRALFDRLYGLNAVQLSVLRGLGLLYEPDLGVPTAPSPALESRTA